MASNVIPFKGPKKPSRKSPRKSPSSPTVLVVFLCLAAALTAGYSYFSLSGSGPHAQIKTFARCGIVRRNCIVDGDTLYVAGEKIRVADIDTPEISEPKCALEKALGERAAERFTQLMNAGPFEMRGWQNRDQDGYGRKLRVLVRNGRSLGDMLVAEGLARRWTGRREPWC